MSNVSNERINLILGMVADYGIEQTCSAFGISRKTIERYMRSANEGIEPKRILIFDIETAPMEAYVWGMWKQDIQPVMLKEDWSVLCWAAMWLGEPDIIESASWFDGRDARDDEQCIRELHALLDEADIVVAHNGDRFDIKRVNTRFLKHGLKPPRPFKSVDTLKIAKRRFSITSNRLDYIGEFLGIGRKVKHEGMEMWKKVLDGDKTAREDMLRYNVGDIVLLERVYLAMRAWDTSHPPANKDYTIKRCTVCSHPHLKRDGEVYTAVSTFAAYQCCVCGHWMRGAVNLKDKDEMAKTTRNAI